MLLTTSKSDKSLTVSHDHLRIVFSSAFKSECLLCSSVYCFKKFKPHNKCFGLYPTGLLPIIFVQTIWHTWGVIPKWDLNRLSWIVIFWPHFVFVIWFPSFRNNVELTSEKQKSRIRKNIHFFLLWTILIPIRNWWWNENVLHPSFELQLELYWH